MHDLVDLTAIPRDSSLRTPSCISSFLRTYLCFVNYAADALEAFLRGDLQQFDAHVGDTACQIRAYRVFLLYHENGRRSLPGMQSSLEALRRIQKLALAHLELGRPLRSEGVLVHGLLRDMGIDFHCGPDLAFLLGTHFLTRFSFVDDEDAVSSRTRGASEAGLPEGMSRNLFEKSVKRFKRAVSTDSCRFVLRLAGELDGLSGLAAAAPDFLRRDELDREVLPAFLSGFVVFRHLLASGLPAAMLVFLREGDAAVRRFHLSLRRGPEGDDFEPGLEPDMDAPCMVMKGEMSGAADKVSLARAVASRGVLRALDAFMAAHRQYSGNKLRGCEDIFDRLLAAHSLGNPAVAAICRRHSDLLWLGKRIIARETDAFLLRHVFSCLLSKTI
jgi:hypothetical protein